MGIVGVIVMGSLLGCRQTPPVRSVSIEQKRMGLIAEKSPQGKRERISLPGFSFFLNSFPATINPEISASAVLDQLKTNPQYLKISKRVGALHSSSKPSGGVVSGGITASFGHPGRRPLFPNAMVCYGVEAVRVEDPGRAPRYYALKPCTEVILSATLAKETNLNLKGPKLTRADFVNPEDIDWMYQVEDFSKSHVN